MTTRNIRGDMDPPEALISWGWRYHHTGIPSSKVVPNEVYLPQFKLYVSGFSTSPFGIEWMRFEPGSPIHPLIRAVPHVAFEVDDLDNELAHRDFTVITSPNSPSDAVRVAMIEHNGAPVELLQFM